MKYTLSWWVSQPKGCLDQGSFDVGKKTGYAESIARYRQASSGLGTGIQETKKRVKRLLAIHIHHIE
jgi:hypothetical protein